MSGVVAGVLVGATAAWLVGGAAVMPRLAYKVGDRVSSEVVAPTHLSVPDPERTEALREEAAARVAPVFDFDPSARAESTCFWAVATSSSRGVCLIRSWASAFW